eukprot:3313872-Pleurochrysis_carterae.AAC.3
MDRERERGVCVSAAVVCRVARGRRRGRVEEAATEYPAVSTILPSSMQSRRRANRARVTPLFLNDASE